MKISYTVDNLKCDGCRTVLKRALSAIPGVGDVQVDLERGLVSMDAPETAREVVAGMLHEMGYPLAGTAAGLAASLSTARSYLSCARGRLG